MTSGEQKTRNAVVNHLKDITHKTSWTNCCSHLSDGRCLSDESPRYVATQIWDDNCTEFWCCENCANEYCVPCPGVFVVDREDIPDRIDIESLIDCENLDDDEINPYQNLLDKEKGFSMPTEELIKMISDNPIKSGNVRNAKYIIPFGIKLISIK